MPPLSAHQSSSTTKMLLIGDNGSGKTGALASLAAAGYNLRIFDLDNGLDILRNLLTAPTSPYGKEALEHVSFQTLTDPMKNQNGALIPKKATVWARVSEQLSNWKVVEPKPADAPADYKEKVIEEFGPVSSWTPKEVLVFDSLSMLAIAAMNRILSMNARLGQQPHQSDWYGAQQLLETLFQLIFDEGIKCNVIMNCHITYIGEENGPKRGYPATLGQALSPKMGSYFNTILMAKSTGSGANAKQKIITRTQGVIELKNSSPLTVLPEYPIETGLADYFKAVRATPAS